MGNELAGKVAIVTGGASGIGRATVLGLLNVGAAVAVLDRNEAGVQSVVEEGSRSGGKRWPCRLTLRIPRRLLLQLRV